MASRNVDMDSWAFGQSNRRSRNPQWALPDHFLWKFFSGQTGNRFVIASLVAFVIVSYLTAQYHHKDQELENIKKFIEVMEFQEVDRVEKACMTEATDVRYLLQCSMHNVGTETVSIAQPKYHDTTPIDKLNNKQLSVIRRLVIPRNSSTAKEVVVMSYIYTTSFDD